MNSFKLAEFGNTLSKQLKELKITDKSKLVLYLDAETLNKLDEDLYYRQFPDGKDFIPSDGEIKIEFDNLIIIIQSGKNG